MVRGFGKERRAKEAKRKGPEGRKRSLFKLLAVSVAISMGPIILNNKFKRIKIINN